MSDFELIRRLRELFKSHETTNFSVLDFVSAFGSPLQALMYSRLFWPEFVEVEGVIVRKDTVEDAADKRRLLASLEENRLDRRAAEKAYNLVEIPSDFFAAKTGETTEDEDRELAVVLSEMWRSRLQELFPKLRFTVEVLEPDETGGEMGIRFYRD